MDRAPIYENNGHMTNSNTELSFGGAVLTAMKRKGWNVAELSRRARVSYDVINKFKHRPDASTSVENGMKLVGALVEAPEYFESTILETKDWVSRCRAEFDTAIKELQDAPDDTIAKQVADSAREDLQGAVEALRELELANAANQRLLTFWQHNGMESVRGTPVAVVTSSPAVRIENGNPAPDGEKLIPVYDVQASAGFGSVVETEEQVHSLAFPPAYLKRLTNSSPSNLAIISVKGDSMEQTLLDDDIVLMDRSKTHLGYDGLFVLNFNDTLHVKRVARSAKPGHVRIISDNHLYPPEDYPVDEVNVVGKVLWYGRKV